MDVFNKLQPPLCTVPGRSSPRLQATGSGHRSGHQAEAVPSSLPCCQLPLRGVNCTNRCQMHTAEWPAPALEERQSSSRHGTAQATDGCSHVSNSSALLPGLKLAANNLGTVLSLPQKMENTTKPSAICDFAPFPLRHLATLQTTRPHAFGLVAFCCIPWDFFHSTPESW